MRTHQLAESDRKERREKMFELSRYFHLRDLETIDEEDVFSRAFLPTITVEDIDQRYASLIMTFKRRVYAIGDFERLAGTIDRQNIPGSYEAVVGLSQLRQQLLKMEVLPLVLQSVLIQKIDLLFNASEHYFLQLKAIKFLHQILCRVESTRRNRQIRPFIKQQSVMNLLQSDNNEVLQQTMKMLKVCIQSSLPFNTMPGHINLLKAIHKISEKWRIAEHTVGLVLIVDLLARYERLSLSNRELSEIHSLILFEILKYSIFFKLENTIIKIFDLVGGQKAEVRKICFDFQKQFRNNTRDCNFIALVSTIFVCPTSVFNKEILEAWKGTILNFINYPYGQIFALDKGIIVQINELMNIVDSMKQREEKMNRALILIEIITGVIQNLMQYRNIHSIQMSQIFQFLQKMYKIRNKKIFRKLNEAVASIIMVGEYLNLEEIMFHYDFIGLFFSDLRYHDGNTDKMSLKKLKDSLILLEKSSPQKHEYIFSLLLKEQNFKKIKSIKQDSTLNNVKQITDYYVNYVLPINFMSPFNVLNVDPIEISE